MVRVFSEILSLRGAVNTKLICKCNAGYPRQNLRRDNGFRELRIYFIALKPISVL